MLRRLRLDPYLLLLFALSLPALAPLLAPGYFYAAHDGRHSVFYLIQFDASLRDGALWPRWAMHHIQGLGYPTFLIQAPLGFYLGEFFVLLGFSFTAAAKLSWAVGTLAGAWGMYALVRHWLGAYGTRPIRSLAVIQFPWRLLALTGFLFSALGGAGAGEPCVERGRPRPVGMGHGGG